MGRRPTTMAVSRGAQHHLLRLCMGLCLTTLCISLAYGSSSQSFDKINLVDESEVGQYQEKKVNVLGDSSLKTNEEIDDSVVGSLRVVRDSGDKNSKNKVKRKKEGKKDEMKKKK